MNGLKKLKTLDWKAQRLNVKAGKGTQCTEKPAENPRGYTANRQRTLKQGTLLETEKDIS